MRVLMLSLDRGLLGKDGSGDVVERHRKYADAAGALDIIVFAGAKYREQSLAENLRVFPTRSRKMAHYRQAFDLAVRLHREQPYDLLVTQDFTAPAGLKIKKILSLPWIVNIHSMFFSARWLGFNLLHWYLLFLVKRAIRRADGFRVNNNEIRNKLVEWGIEKPILVQPTPVDVERFLTPSFNPSPHGGGKDTVQVLYVGRLETEKNVGMLIRAFMNLRGDYKLAIIGTGSQELELKKLAAPDLRVEFLGPRSIEELPEIFWSADIFVLPSNTESFGQVLLQAAASELAVIATDTPGAREVLGEGETGILVPVNSQKDLERELRGLLSKVYEREYWAKKARDMAERYDAAAGLGRTIDFWKEIAVASSNPLSISPSRGGERRGK